MQDQSLRILVLMTTELGMCLRICVVKCDAIILGWIRQEIGDIRGDG